jgi:starch-binding outer membrane protein, SusD/RagB family
MKITLAFLSACMLLLLFACKKDFLNKKPNKVLAVPSTLQDMQYLLDNDQYMNSFYTSIQEISSDDFYITGADWNSLSSPTTKAAYIWSDDVFNDVDNNDWSFPYIAVQYSNIVLDAANKYKPLSAAETEQLQQITGAAMFIKGFTYYTQMQVFGLPFDAATADHDLGIVLRSKPGIDEQSVRSSVKECYEEIIRSASEAVRLLPITQPYKTRPTKAAAYGLLAKVYLSMRDYDKAGLYADSCLQQQSSLIDYNTLNAASANPVPRYNTEVVFQALITNRTPFSTTAYKVDSTLYSSYATNDLRRTMFFKATGSAFYFVGSYNGNTSPFGGIATDEIFLIRAESKARSGNKDAAMADLNTLLQKRFRTGFFTPLTASDANDALVKVLKERRKELVLRGTRWADLRRLNKEPQFATTISRIVNAQTYTLPPNDLKYTFVLPLKVIQITGMPQTPR